MSQPSQTNLIPLLTSFSAVFDFFRAAGYQVEPTEWDTAGLPDSTRAALASLYLVADHREGQQTFQVFLAELREMPANVRRARRSDMRPLVEHFYRYYPQGDYLFIFALADYSSLTLVSPRRAVAARASLQFASPGAQADKIRLRLLAIDPQRLTRTDRDILHTLALGPDEQTPAAILKKYEAAFSVEKVTRDFYNEYRAAFERLKDELTAIRSLSQRHAVAQRMLSRLLFLCFLQKKYWLDQKPDYLFQLFDRAEREGRNFYADFLHDLFFNGLNNYGRETLSSRQAVADLEERIGLVPFLNGGLFEMIEPWDEPGKLRLDNAVFRPLLGPEGLLRRYNFTIAESTPDYQEVAVDPEMLGKVFESIVLQSETAEDYNAPDLRKATGSYYTPRIVVQFICRELLRQHLAEQMEAPTPALSRRAGEGEGGGWRTRLTELMRLDATDGLSDEELARLNRLLTPDEADRLNDLLDHLRACDPAVGSGAFALGLLQELVNLRILCDTRAGGRDPRLIRGPDYIYQTKLHFIESAIYGVDLQAQAVEICKLRLWLSLVVDHELAVDARRCTRAQFRAALAAVQPLPNLGFKIRQGDALLEQIHGQPFRLEHLPTSGRAAAVITRFMNELQEAQARFFSEQNPDKKRNLRRRALEARLRFTEHVLEHLLDSLPALQPPLLGDETPREAELRRWRQAQEAKIRAAQEALTKMQRKLAPLFAKTRLAPADEELLDELETGDEKHLTFAWQLAFPEVFRRLPSPTPQPPPSPKLGRGRGQGVGEGGFDLILGNPPFVTARNPEKRELYRERWKETAYQKYQLVAPFFQRGFGLLRPGGHLGFIVSNAFAKREFGKPLVQDFFPTVELLKVVDCSGLMFPGHGTPTCLVFGRRPTAPLALGRAERPPVRVAAILPGGGDLRTDPQDSPLWRTLTDQHDNPGYSDERIVVADRPAAEMAKWPWNFDVSAEPTRRVMERASDKRLAEIIEGEVGVCTMTNADDVFPMCADEARRFQIPRELLQVFQEGDSIRDWSMDSDVLVLTPYDDEINILSERELGQARKYLLPYKQALAGRKSFGNKTFEELGRPWYSFERMNANKYANSRFIAFGEIATHGHFVFHAERRVYKQTCQTIKLPDKSYDDHHLLAGLLNSSAALFWLKQVCFNKAAGEEEERDRFVYAGGKVQQLPIPSAVLEPGPLRERLTALSRACWERGQQLPGLAFKKLFEMPGEAYYAWNSSLAGWVAPAPVPPGRGRAGVGVEWRDAESLSAARQAYTAERERLRSEMIALQEEMDWLVYAAYGLISDFRFLIFDFGLSDVTNRKSAIENLQLGERPFELAREGKPIPARFSAERRALWEARLKAIAENEHIRRIEQPVYKRRWYRKISDEQEFQRAFEWWLLEKAEWWLEHQAQGGPVLVERWAAALWDDARVRAASNLQGLADLASFTGWFQDLVHSVSVPEGLPPAVPWEQLGKVPARVRKIRGKLNVPRERFWERGRGEYVWAGKRQGV